MKHKEELYGSVKSVLCSNLYFRKAELCPWRNNKYAFNDAFDHD